MKKDALNKLSQRFDCGDRIGTISMGRDRFNFLIFCWVLGRSNSYGDTAWNWMQVSNSQNRPGNDGTSSGKSNGGYSLPPCTCHRGRVDFQQVIAHSSAISTEVSHYARCYSGEESSIYQRRYLNVHEPRFHPAVKFALHQDDQAFTRVVLFRCRCKDANSWMKTGNGQVSCLCQITRNEQSGSLELIISAQVRIAQEFECWGKKLHRTRIRIQFDG